MQLAPRTVNAEDPRERAIGFFENFMRTHAAEFQRPSIRSVTVCLSAQTLSKDETEVVRQIGTLLAEKGVHVFTGGTTAGCMGIIADAILKARGTIHGIVPEGPELAGVHSGLTSKSFVPSLAARKTEMNGADALVALWGSWNTLDELNSACVLKDAAWKRIMAHCTGILRAAEIPDDLKEQKMATAIRHGLKENPILLKPTILFDQEHMQAHIEQCVRRGTMSRMQADFVTHVKTVDDLAQVLGIGQPDRSSNPVIIAQMLTARALGRPVDAAIA